MKNLFTLLFLTLTFTIFAQTIDLVVFSESGDDFILFVNSIKQNEEPRANVKAKDLKGESFVLRIEFEDESIPKMTKNIWTESKDVELTAIVKQNKKGKYVLRYMGETPKNSDTDMYTEDNYVVYEDPEADSGSDYSNEVVEELEEEVVVTTNVTTEHVVGDNIDMSDEDVNLSMNVSAGEDGMSVEVGEGNDVVNLDVSVDENGMSVSGGAGEDNISLDLSVSGTGMDSDDEDVNMNMSITATGLDADADITESYTSTTTTTTTTSSSSVVSTDEINEEEIVMNNDLVIVQDEPLNTRCSFAMSDSDFQAAVADIKEENFEDDKFDLAKSICSTNCMTSTQVHDINKIFSYEDTRLEFAKYAYDYVYDISNYYKVKKSFTFSMTKDELQEYLDTK